MRILPGLGGLALVLAVPLALGAQDLASFEKRTTVKVLDNGLRRSSASATRRRSSPSSPTSTPGPTARCRGSRPRAHVRAHGVQGHRHDRHQRTPKAEKSGARRRSTRPIAPTTGAAQGRGRQTAQKLEQLEKAVEGRAGRRGQVRREERVRRGRRAGGRRGTERHHLERRDRLHLLAFPANRLELWGYLESERFLRPRAAGVLQGAGRGHRGAPARASRASRSGG